jgi:ABC-type amino acid transport system permease subunit
VGQFFETFFSWEHFTNSLPQVLKGFATNLSLMVVAEVFVLVWGLVLALVRSSQGARWRRSAGWRWAISTCSGRCPA